MSTRIVSAQINRTYFSNEPLAEVLQQLEERHELSFNWDPELLSGYKFDGEINLDNLDKSLNKLFLNTPFTFEITENTILVYSATQQNYSICGFIKDSKTNAPLSYANVYYNSRLKGTQSDEQGYFEMSIKGIKNDQLILSYIGFQSDSVRLHTFRDQSCPTFYLELDEEIFNGKIVITDYILRGVNEGKEYSSINIQLDENLLEVPIIEQDILKTTQLMPGVSSLDDSASNIQIRGATADQNLILWEGATLYDAGHFFGMISAVNPFVVKEVDIYKGVFHPRYDNRVGGIIDMSLSDSVSPKTRGGFGTTLTEAHGYFELPLIDDKLSILSSGRYTINSLWETPTISNYAVKVFQESKVIEEDESETEQVIDFNDWNAKILFRPIDQLLFKLAYFSSNNVYNFSVPFFDDGFNSQDAVDASTKALSLSAEWQHSEKWHTKFLYTSSEFQNQYELTVTENETDDIIESRFAYNDIIDNTFSFINEFNFSEKWSTQFGYDFNRKAVNFDLIFESEYEEEFEDFNFLEANFHNLYVSGQYLNGPIQVEGGLRSTFIDETNQTIFSPRLNFQLALNDQIKLKASGGILQQYISQLKEFGDTDLGIDNPIWVLNQSEVDENNYQEAQKLSLGLIFNKADWLIDMDAYVNKTDGLNTINPLFGQVEVPDFEFGYSMAKGVDLLIRKKTGVLNSWLNYSFSQVDYNFPSISDQDFPATNDVRHQLSFINNLNYKNWQFSINYQYRTGLRFSSPEELISFDDDEGNLVYEILYGDLNQNRLNDYHRLDFGISYLRSFSTGMTAQFTFSMINLFDYENSLSRNYHINDFDDDEVPEIAYFDKFLLGRTPQILMRVFW